MIVHLQCRRDAAQNGFSRPTEMQSVPRDQEIVKIGEDLFRVVMITHEVYDENTEIRVLLTRTS